MEWINNQLKAVGLGGFEDKRNIAKVKTEIGGNVFYNHQLFFEKHDDGLQINYFNHKNETEMYDYRGKLRQFSRIRLKNATDKQKYSQPRESGNHIFNTPSTLEAKEIETLFLSEGEKKAFKLSEKICIAGLGGKDNFSDKNSKLLLESLSNLIEAKKVLNLVLLLDSDVFKLGSDEDLFKRPLSFCNTVIRFNALCRSLNCNVYFAHVEESFLQQGITGIDDLVNYYEAEENNVALDKIFKELNMLATGMQHDRNFIKCYNVSNLSEYNIRKLFYVENIHSFFKFYNLKCNVEYKLNRNIYKFSLDDAGKLSHQLLSWGDANRYLKIGKDYKKIVYNEDSNLEFKDHTKVSIKDDCNTKSDAIFSHIKKVDGCVYLPDNTDKYRDFIESYNLNGDEETKSTWFNVYQKLNYNYTTADGKWDNIEHMLKHIFSQKNLLGDELYEFILDYLTILFFKPTLRLPAICLVSFQRSTGKTTFLDFLKLLFKGNACEADNTRLSEKWTSTYANSLVITVDETIQTEDQKQKKEQLKNLITSKTIWNEAKGTNAVSNRFYGKFVFASNDEFAFMQIDNVENRFCVIKVKQLKDTCENFDILQKMAKELEPFLTFLYKRMQNNIQNNNSLTYYPQKTRLYFDYNVYTTEALKNVQDNSEDAYIRNVREYLLDLMYNAKELIIYLTAIDLKNIFKITNISNAKISEALKRLGFERKRMRYKTYYRFDSSVGICEDDTLQLKKISKNGEAFIVTADKLMNENNLNEFAKECHEANPESNVVIDKMIELNNSPKCLF